MFSVCVVLLVTVWQASAQAPGDEDQRCLHERAAANDVYPQFTKMLMDSRNYEELISGSRPHWQQLNVDGTGYGVGVTWVINLLYSIRTWHTQGCSHLSGWSGFNQTTSPSPEVSCTHDYWQPDQQTRLPATCSIVELQYWCEGGCKSFGSISS